MLRNGGGTTRYSVHLSKRLFTWTGRASIVNRAFALSKVKGKEAAIREVEKLDLANNHYYYTLLGELYRDYDNQKSKRNFQKALSLAKTQADKRIIQKKIDLF